MDEKPFLLDCWYVAAWSSDLGQDLMALSIASKPVLLYRKASGEVVALEDRCVHRHAPLSLGRREGDAVRCMYHGLKFAADGRCIEIPGQADIPARACVPTYPVVERDGWVWVWPGHPGRADAALVPQATGPDNPEWNMGFSQLDYAAHYQLINDNLLDFSHLSFVHANSFKADGQWAERQPRIQRLTRGVRVSRWITGAPALSSALDLAGAITDTWQSYDFLVPGVLLMRTFFCEAGAAEAAGGEAPTHGILRVNATSQAVTPLDSARSRYFFAFGSRAQDTDDRQAARILEIGSLVFGEDRAVIEGQQRTKDLDPARAPMPIRADGAIIHFMAVKRQLMKEAAAQDEAGLEAMKTP